MAAGRKQVPQRDRGRGPLGDAPLAHPSAGLTLGRLLASRACRCFTRRPRCTARGAGQQEQPAHDGKGRGQDDRTRCSEGSLVFCPNHGVHFSQRPPAGLEPALFSTSGRCRGRLGPRIKLPPSFRRTEGRPGSSSWGGIRRRGFSCPACSPQRTSSRFRKPCGRSRRPPPGRSGCRSSRRGV